MKSNTLKKQGLRRCEHDSSYFGGAFNRYGRYQWDIKYHGWQSEYEIESAREYFFGEFRQLKVNDSYLFGCESIDELLGRKIKASIQGRSGGWLVIDTELTASELKKIDRFVSRMMTQLPKYLKGERDFQKQQEVEAMEDEKRREIEIKGNAKLKQAVELIRSQCGADFTLLCRGIRLG